MTSEGVHIVNEARKRYLRALYKYIKNKYSTDEAYAWNKFSTILAFATVLTVSKFLQ